MTEFEKIEATEVIGIAESAEAQLGQCRAVLGLIWSKYVIYAYVDSEDLDAVKSELPEICSPEILRNEGNANGLR